MVRKAIAPTHLLEYLQNLSKSPLSYGLIIGQPSDEKDYILHLARTPLTTTEVPTKNEISNVSQIPESSISEHAIHTTRMLPGGLYVLGLFFVTKENISKTQTKKLMTLLQQVQSHLGNNPWLYGNHANSTERLILHFNPHSKEYDGKLLNINTGSFNPVSFVFMNKDPQWCQLECKFDFNDVMKPISVENSSVSLKNQLKTITGSLNSHLKHATFIFDNKICSPNDIIDCKNFSKRIKKDNIDDINEEKIINVTLLIPTTNRKLYEAEMVDNAGSVRILGQIASTVWLNPQTTYEVAAKAIVEDIIRSFQARLSMHFDSLTEGESGIFNDICSLHEPPRRVQIQLPNGSVSLSDYLFPGEGSQEAQISFKDVLDVPLPQKHSIRDSEGEADLSGYYNEIASRDSNELPLPLPTDTNKFMYIVGAGVAVAVLIISLLIHFLREYNFL